MLWNYKNNRAASGNNHPAVTLLTLLAYIVLKSLLPTHQTRIRLVGLLEKSLARRIKDYIIEINNFSEPIEDFHQACNGYWWWLGASVCLFLLYKSRCCFASWATQIISFWFFWHIKTTCKKFICFYWCFLLLFNSNAAANFSILPRMTWDLLNCATGNGEIHIGRLC